MRLSIKSFKVPELSIEIAESASVATLKVNVSKAYRPVSQVDRTSLTSVSQLIRGFGIYGSSLLTSLITSWPVSA